ncbi:hypothetical protein Tco_0561130 [Tanacetum coccineum]
MDSLRKNKTRELVDHPAGQKLVSCKLLFKIKEGIEGVQNPRYKARKWMTSIFLEDFVHLENSVHYLRAFETEFLTIVYNDALASKLDFSSEPTDGVKLGSNSNSEDCSVNNKFLAGILPEGRIAWNGDDDVLDVLGLD